MKIVVTGTRGITNIMGGVETHCEELFPHIMSRGFDVALIRMSCNTYRANYFRLFLYAAVFVMAHSMKHTIFKNTQVERFTMDSLIKRIMLSAVYITEKKTFIRISFSPHHRHLEEMKTALRKITA